LRFFLSCWLSARTYVLSTPVCRMTSVSSAEALTFCSQVERDPHFLDGVARPGGDGLARLSWEAIPVPERIQESVVGASCLEVR
jgi:hypothetical protein